MLAFFCLCPIYQSYKRWGERLGVECNQGAIRFAGLISFYLRFEKINWLAEVQ